MNARRWLSRIIIATLFPAAIGAQQWALTPGAGRYNEPVRLLSTRSDVEFRFLRSDRRTPHTDAFYPLSRVVVLDAPAGATLEYHLELRDASGALEIVTYTIDRSIPAVPNPETTPAVYDRAVEVLFPETPGVTIYATTGRESAFSALPGDLTLEGTPGEVVDYAVSAFAEDAAGNRSPVESWRYRVDRSRETDIAADFLLSPVSGTFANEQLLLVETRGLDGVEYSLDSSGEWVDYTGPVVVRGAGERSVVVRGIDRTTGGERSISRSWAQATRDPARSFASGAHPGGITIETPPERYRYSLADRPVSVSSPVLIQALLLDGIAGSRQTYTLRLLPMGNPGATEERYTFVIDRRQPPAPKIVEWDGTLALFSLAGSEVRYAVDGGTWLRTDGTVVPTPGSTVTASARFPTGSWGAQSHYAVPPERDVPAPSVKRAPRLAGNRYSIIFDRGGTDLSLSLDGVAFSSPFQADDAGEVAFTIPRAFYSTIAVRAPGLPEISRLAVDMTPTAAPTVSVTGTTVTLDGTAPIEYRVVRRADDNTAFEPYESPIVLQGEPGLLTEYRVDAYAVSEAGPRSAIVSQIVPVDRRSPFVPPFTGISDGELTNREMVEISFSQSDEDMVVHYEYRLDGTVAPTPTEESPSAGESIRIPTGIDPSQRLSIALRARFQGSSTWSTTRLLTVTVDRIPPPPPALTSPGTDIVSPTAVPLTFAPPEPGSTVMFRTSPDAPFSAFSQPLAMGADPGKSRVYTIEAYAVDAAGNRSETTSARSVTIDRAPPSMPRFIVDGQIVSERTLVRNAPVEVDIRSDSDATVYYGLNGMDRAEPPLFERWMGTAIPLGDSGADGTTYVIEAYGEDPLGNIGTTASLQVTIDTTAPPQPPEPTVSRRSEGTVGYLYWPTQPDGALYVSVGTRDFERYRDPITWDASNAPIDVRYFALDAAGNRSPTGRTRVAGTSRAAPPAVTGIEDGAAYVSGVSIEAIGTTPVRYSIATDGGSAPPVHAFSPLLGSPLELDASPGATLAVELRVRAYTADGTASDESVYRFSIDRESPPPPKLSGADDDGYYAEARRVALIPGDATDRIYYRSYTLDRAPPDFRPYGGQPINLPGVSGRTAAYVVEAYSQDAGGNRSQFVERWDIVVDREIVYVDSNQSGRGNGSRSAPFRDLAPALQNASQLRRSTVLLAPGEYVLPAALVASLSGDAPFQFVGWNGIARISADVPRLSLPAGTALQNVKLLTPVTVESNDSARPTRFESVRVEPRTIDDGALSFTGGRVILDEVSIADGTISLSAVDGRITGSSLDGVEVTGGTLEITTSTVTTIQSTDTSVSISGSLIEPEELTTAVPAVSVRGGGVTLSDSIVRSARGDGVLFLVADGDVEVAGSTLAINGNTGAVALRLVRATAEVHDSILVAGGNARVQYAIVTRDTTARIENSVLYATGSEESYGVAGSGGFLNLSHGLVAVGGGEYARSAIAFGGNTATVTNSIFVSLPETGRIAGRRTSVPTALYFDQLVNRARAAGNLFGPWEAFSYSRPVSRPTWRERAYQSEVSEVGEGNATAQLDPAYGIPPFDEIFTYTGTDRRSIVFAERGNWLEPPEGAVDLGVNGEGPELDFTGRRRTGTPDAGPIELR